MVEKKIVKRHGSLGKSGDWDLELNEVSWNGASPKYDIRAWSPDHERCGKGLTFTEEQMQKLKELLSYI